MLNVRTTHTIRQRPFFIFKWIGEPHLGWLLDVLYHQIQLDTILCAFGIFDVQEVKHQNVCVDAYRHCFDGFVYGSSHQFVQIWIQEIETMP